MADAQAYCYYIHICANRIRAARPRYQPSPDKFLRLNRLTSEDYSLGAWVQDASQWGS